MLFVIIYWIYPRDACLVTDKDDQPWLWVSRASARRWAKRNIAAWSTWKVIELV
jgi:hypothetical protein